MQTCNFYSGSMSSICNIYDCTFWGCFQNFLLDSGFCIARIRWSLTQKHYVLYHSINVLNFKMSSFSRFLRKCFLVFSLIVWNNPSLFGMKLNVSFRLLERIIKDALSVRRQILATDEKCFLFYLKSSFCYQDI